MRPTGRGFSLIEIMVSIAIAAIVLPVIFSCQKSFQWFTHEENYRHAFFQAGLQQKELASRPWESLPPEVVKVPGNGKVRLRESRIIPDSLRIYMNGISMNTDQYRLKGRDLVFSSPLPGMTAVVEYDFLLPDAREAATVPLRAPFEVKLLNTPVTEVLSVRKASGAGLLPVAPSLYETYPSRGIIAFDGSLAGTVVEFRYFGEMLGTRAHVSFLTESLEVTHMPGPVKSITIEETYGRKINSFTLTTLSIRSGR